ncbi:MAG: oxidoreductase [Myxococcaceae bacterium]|nr:oxidoreductase [Myxococcaceae bacterium]MCI0670270.1 oxidoreductase [Myxococcaceae bacterium]
MTAHPVTLRKRPELFEVRLQEVRFESPDTATLYLDAGERKDYRAGQYVSISPHQFLELRPWIAWLEEQKGRKEPVRPYSLSSAPHEDLIAITVKEEEYIPGRMKYPPLLSNLLVRGLHPGARFTVLGYSGPYVLPDDLDERCNLVVHVVAGSGAVPNFGILKDALHRGHRARHVYVASNKTRQDILYHGELTALERRYPDRLRVVHALTRDPDAGESFRHGRISDALLHEVIPESERETCLVYACGPAILPWDRRAALEAGTSPTPRFMETVLGHLHTLGIHDKRIRRETYG